MSREKPENKSYTLLTPLEDVGKLIVKAGKHDFCGMLLAVDPGETTGMTVISRAPTKLGGSILLHAMHQVSTWPFEEAARVFRDYIPSIDACVYEAYHIYQWRLNEHTFSGVPTIQIIGCLQTRCFDKGVKVYSQTAQTGKAFWTDDQLKRFNAYFPGMHHARDSLRHALQFLMFGIKSD